MNVKNCHICLQDVSGVYNMLALDNPELRRAAAELVAQLVEEQGRAAVTEAAAAVKEAVATAQQKQQQGGKSSGKAGARASRTKAGASSSKVSRDNGDVAVAAAADEILCSVERLQLFGLLAVMARMALPQVGCE
jgi:hypothetical protein